MTRRGFTLVEVTVAVAVLATAGVALERLLARSVGTIEHDARRARTLVAARAHLTEAALRPPPLGQESWSDPDGLQATRDVEATAHPSLRQVHVRVETAGGGDASDLVELVYVPPR